MVDELHFQPRPISHWFRVCILIGIVGISCFGVPHVLSAQIHDEASETTPDRYHNRSVEPGDRPGEGESVTALPEWAEPGTRGSRGTRGRSRSESSISQDAQSMNQPPLPGDEPNVPVDGGLIWLVLVGGAYATWKLGWENGILFRLKM